MALRDKRKLILDYIQNQSNFLKRNAEALDIYEGNLRTYVESIMRNSLSPQYFNAIRDRILPINILQRYIDKVSTVYNVPPTRSSEDESLNKFVEFYVKEMNLNQSGTIVDQYANLFKGYAWKPYIDKNGNAAMKELSFDRFLVMSDSLESPEQETVFIEFMGKSNDKDLFFVWTDSEFDAFYSDASEASEFLVENQGINLIGTIPYIYGKRQKNRLLPVQDSDILAITKAIPCMISDAAGAQLFQCFTILYGIDVSSENLTISPNAFWSIKSDKDSDKTPVVGSIKPEADTDKVIDFVMNIFVLWLETKGIRVGSMGAISGSNAASGIAKIIDEMDVYDVKKKSMEWFKKDEEDLWNNKLPKIHNYWIKTGMLKTRNAPSLIVNPDMVEILVEFEFPEPMISKTERLDHIGKELEMGTMSKKQAILELHPDLTEDEINEMINGVVNVVDKKEDLNTEDV